ncbi:hypothetical protein M758_3G144000 [Ceratodon purpureus]|nr:hypothetical protein M758_3G144000 [Ceratodon purpureus]KAG0623034.1 hypothetical protein M758_3G144000 [Ceratodon purpureus]
MAEEMGRVVLIGKTGSGKSTLANMLVSGKLEDSPVAPIGGGVRGTTRTCKTYCGRGWTVVDTMGFGEPKGGTVPDEDARKMVTEFLKEVKGRYSHIIFVKGKGRLDTVDAIIWEAFRQIFSGGEEKFVVLFTKVDEPDWLDENREDIEKDFPECKHFLSVDFPGVDLDSEMEEINALYREEELEKLEKQMKEMFQSSPWVEPDIFRMEDEEINKKANNVLEKIAAFIKKLMKDYGKPAAQMSITIFVSIAQLVVMFAGGT